MFLGVVSLFLASAEAAEISLVQAETAAGNWLVRNRHPLNADIGTVPTGGTTYRDAAGTALFHVVKIMGGGFIVTSADDAISPIVAISESDDLAEDADNGLWVLLNKDMANRQLALSVDRTTTSSLLLAAAAVATPSEGSPEAEWAKLLDESSFSILGLSSITDVRVSPLVKSTWDQAAWDQATVPNSSKYTYNYYTPNHYVCGCVATAMSQLMRYHQFPTASRSVVTKTCYVSDVATSLSTKAGTYAWSNMPLTPTSSITDTQREAIGRLTYDAGVSVRMQYDTTANGGSGAYTLECADALKSTFGYANGMSYLPSTFTTNVINRAVLANLDGGYPILLGITGTPGGHAIVGDGYGYSSSKLYVHLNMGWSGDQNAWYNLPTVDTAYGTFSTISTIVYNVYTNGTGDLVTGRIFDENGAAITGAAVRAYQNNTLNATTVTGTNGVYALRVTISGSSATFTIVASNSYLAATSSVTVAKSVSLTYTAAGQSISGITNGTVGNSWGNDMVLRPTSLPTAPTAVSATDGAYSNAVVVTWSGATSAASYSVWRGGNASSASALLIASDITEQTYSDASTAINTKYYYWVKATNSLGSSSFSTVSDSGYSAPSAPLNVSASDGTRTDGVLVTWSAVPNATQYCLFRAATAGATPTQSSSWTTGLCVTNTSAVAGTTYYYYVKAASNTTYPSALSAYDTGYRALAVPTAPTGVSATDGTSTNLITISWSTVSGATSYEVWRGTTSSSASATSLATGISAVTYADSTASPAVRYYYWLKAVNSSGTSSFSASDTGYLGLSSPAAVSATDGTSTTMVTVTWTAAPGAGSNEVWRGTTASPASATSLATGITAATYSDTTVVPGTLYYYWVKAVNEVATSAFSGSNTGYRALSAPTAVSASDGSSTTEVTVTWTGATGAASNEVWRGTTANPASATRLVTGITAATYSDITAVPGTLYTYWTKAVTAISTSTLSGSNTGYRALSAPTAVSASDGTTTNGVIVTWGAVTGASYYQVSRADTLAGTKTVLGSWQTALIYTDASSVAGSNYYYFVVAAVDGSGGYASASSTYDIGYRQVASLGTSTSPVSVPYAWLDSYALVTAGNYEAAANFDSDQDGADAWEEYVAGTVPTNGASVFRSRISLVNGVPVVDWTPDLGVSRTYTLYGKTNLQDAVWFAPTNSGVRFFRVKVELK